MLSKAKGTTMLGRAIKDLRKDLLYLGEPVTTANWQGMEQPPEFLEILDANFSARIPGTVEEITAQCNPLLPWADLHFEERVSGIPHNPPPSHSLWLKDTDKSLEADGRFSHTYPERMHQNLFTLVELFKKDPTTRQGYLPIWNIHKDGVMALENRRVPCTLGWHWILRDEQLNCFYPMRSCDALRHFHNDIYFAARLTLWLIEKANLKAVPGDLNFHAVSFHCFTNDTYALEKSVK